MQKYISNGTYFTRNVMNRVLFLACTTGVSGYQTVTRETHMLGTNFTIHNLLACLSSISIIMTTKTCQAQIKPQLECLTYRDHIRRVREHGCVYSGGLRAQIFLSIQSMLCLAKMNHIILKNCSLRLYIPWQCNLAAIISPGISIFTIIWLLTQKVLNVKTNSFHN